MGFSFSRDDLERFAVASHDRNPLHLSAAYARRSAFGEPVVFGVLAALAAMNPEVSAELAKQSVEKISILFRRPLLAGVGYQATTLRKGRDRLNVSIEEAGTALAGITLHLSPRPWQPWGGDGESPPKQAFAATSIALSREPEQLVQGLGARGLFAPENLAFHDLARQYHMDQGPLSPAQMAALLWCSYLIGMELPGERALFSKLEISFQPGSVSQRTDLEYDARVINFDERFDLAEIQAELTCEGAAVAAVKLSAFVRRDTPPVDLVKLHAACPGSTKLLGKVALVIGGSRGLGAAIAAGLVSQGCAVLATHREGTVEINALKELLKNESGSFDGMMMNAADMSDCQSMCQRIDAQFGKLNVIVSNAAPPLRAFSFSTENIKRFREYIDQSVAITASPLAASLRLLRANSGAAILISSSSASPLAADYPQNWHHYIAAKYAAEGLFRASALQTPEVQFIIARPPRLLTDQSNTPQGRHAAMPVERAAVAILRRLLDAPSEHVSVIDEF